MREILLRGQRIRYQLERKAVKYINLRVHTGGTVWVSANRHVPLAQVEAVLREKESFVLNARAKMAHRNALAPPPKAYIPGEQFRICGELFTLEQGTAPGVHASRGVLRCGPGDLRAQVQQWIAQTSQAIFAKTAQTATALLAEEPIPVPVTLKMRRMVSRWGSCNPGRGIVTLSTRLLETPLPCIEAVVLHEYVHFLHPDHSAHFYAMLERYMPDYRARIAPLRGDAYHIFYNE